jgi:RNA polymerase sigma-70 factor (ECF subfamily)
VFQVDEQQLLADARRGDESAFQRLAERHRGELYAHCYRMLGSVQDAEDAVQESLLGAWRGLASFEGRSSLRTWLLRVATNACLRLSSRRPRRILVLEHGRTQGDLQFDAALGDVGLKRLRNVARDVPAAW